VVRSPDTGSGHARVIRNASHPASASISGSTSVRIALSSYRELSRLVTVEL